MESGAVFVRERLAPSKPGGTQKSQARSFGRDVKKLTGPIKRMAATPTAAKEREREKIPMAQPDFDADPGVKMPNFGKKKKKRGGGGLKKHMHAQQSKSKQL